MSQPSNFRKDQPFHLNMAKVSPKRVFSIVIPFKGMKKFIFTRLLKKEYCKLNMPKGCPTHESSYYMIKGQSRLLFQGELVSFERLHQATLSIHWFLMRPVQKKFLSVKYLQFEKAVVMLVQLQLTLLYLSIIQIQYFMGDFERVIDLQRLKGYRLWLQALVINKGLQMLKGLLSILAQFLILSRFFPMFQWLYTSVLVYFSWRDLYWGAYFLFRNFA